MLWSFSWLAHESMLENLQHKINFLVQSSCRESNSELYNFLADYWVLRCRLVTRFFSTLVFEIYLEVHIQQTLTPDFKITFHSYTLLFLEQRVRFNFKYVKFEANSRPVEGLNHVLHAISCTL